MIIRRLVAAFSTLPTLGDWEVSLFLLLLLALIVLPLGFKFGFFKIDFVKMSWQKLIAFVLFLFLMPAMGEELLFHVLILPNTSLENPSLVSISCFGSISLIAYVIYHPLNALTFYTQGFSTFIKPFFLFSTTLLGAICTVAYYQSGSLWPSLFVHWVVVVTWLVLLGGYSILHN